MNFLIANLNGTVYVSAVKATCFRTYNWPVSINIVLADSIRRELLRNCRISGQHATHHTPPAINNFTFHFHFSHGSGYENPGRGNS